MLNHAVIFHLSQLHQAMQTSQTSPEVTDY